MPAAGSYSDVSLIGSEEVLHGAGARALRDSLQAPVPDGLEPEPSFHVSLVPEGRVASERFYKNLILASTQDAPGPAGRELRRLLQPEDLSRGRREGIGIFLLHDAYARRQVVVLLVASSPARLDSLLAATGQTLRGDLERSVLERDRDELVRGGPEHPGAAAHGASFGFEIRAPAAYGAASPNPAWRDALELVRESPTRILTVYWIDDVDAARAVSPQYLLGLQRDVMWRLHGDTLVEERARFAPGRLGDAPSLCLRGMWQNAPDVAGGPLVTHFVYDARRRRLYGVQALLFAPGREKRPFLRELRVLAETFRIGGPT
jgi:hypothetical protein